MDSQWKITEVERLLSSGDPESEAVELLVGSAMADRVGERLQSTNSPTKAPVVGLVEGEDKSQRHCRQRKAAAVKGTPSSCTAGHWTLTPICQGLYGGWPGISLPTLDKSCISILHRANPPRSRDSQSPEESIILILSERWRTTGSWIC